MNDLQHGESAFLAFLTRVRHALPRSLSFARTSPSGLPVSPLLACMSCSSWRVFDAGAAHMSRTCIIYLVDSCMHPLHVEDL
jgi:hypothetical protein